jgi:HPr kinase/phosphorylase
MQQPEAHSVLHATSVDVDGQGILILGATGSGKSSLALGLIGQGASLISDDQTLLERHGEIIILGCPTAAMAGVIEVRGMGLIRSRHSPQATLALVVDLGQQETDRLPEPRTLSILGRGVPLLLNPNQPYFPVALMLQLRHGRYV